MFIRSARKLLKFIPVTYKPGDNLSNFKPYQHAVYSLKFRYYNIATDKTSEDEITIDNNPYYKKYEDKIKKLREENKDEFLSRIQELSEKKTKRHAPLASKSAQSEKCHYGKNKMDDHKNVCQPSYTQKKKLDDIVNLEKITTLNAKEIEMIWKTYHSEKDSLCAVIPVDIYETMHKCSLECPNFIYALSRKEGFEFIFGQFSGDTCYFTPLINYQTYKEEAPVCLTLNHFTEISRQKKIILMSGEFDSNIITAVEAQFLANQVQLYYVTNNVKRKLLLWTFNKEPHNFKHTDIIKELESYV